MIYIRGCFSGVFMFVNNIEKSLSTFCAFIFAAHISFVCAADEMSDELVSLMQRNEIDMRNVPLKISDMDADNPTDLYVSRDKLNMSGYRVTYLNKHKAILPDQHARLAPILAEIESRRFDENVHALDGHVVSNLTNLLNIARSLELGRSISLNDALIIVRNFDIVSSADLDRLCSGFDELHVELFSRVATFAEDLYLRRESEIGINQFITITDNWTTQGGCFAGRRNRLYVALATMMANIGV